jgi:hypothetical protein
MQVASLHDGRWSSDVLRLSEVADLEATARRFGAFQRARKVRNAEELLGVDQQPAAVPPAAVHRFHGWIASADTCQNRQGSGKCRQIS